MHIVFQQGFITDQRSLRRLEGSRVLPEKGQRSLLFIATDYVGLENLQKFTLFVYKKSLPALSTEYI
jgi:hypothetical protein